MSFKKRVDIFETYDRARTGPKIEENDWDQKIIFRNASRLKEKYKLKFDRKVIIPTDEDMIDRLFLAGLEMLLETGVFCMDTSRLIKYTEDEVRMAIASAPKQLILGEGRDARVLKQRRFNDSHPPLTQGGPTGAPVSESIFIGDA